MGEWIITAVAFDYGFGSVRPMVHTLTDLGVDVTLTSDHRQPLKADDLVVPGVGVFAVCMEGLKKVDGDHMIYGHICTGRPMLGAHVSEQTMFEHGLGHGTHAAGIGLIDGSTNLLDVSVVPHIGWDTTEAAPDSVLLSGMKNERFYSIHSYATMEVKPANTFCFDIDLGDPPEYVSWCSYGRPHFVAACEHGPLSVTQFHPEKSGGAGSQLLKNWIAAL